jgi:hypothetical protein
LSSRGDGTSPGSEETTGSVFRPPAILEALEAEDVRYVVIGGTGAAIGGASHVTFDLDITPERSRDNLDRLAAALRRLDARLAEVPAEVAAAFEPDVVTLDNRSLWTFSTKHGRLDVALEPSGTQGYRDLRRGAQETEIDGVRIVVASLEDVIRSKEAANRERDRAVLPDLRRTLELKRRRESGE